MAGGGKEAREAYKKLHPSRALGAKMYSQDDQRAGKSIYNPAPPTKSLYKDLENIPD